MHNLLQLNKGQAYDVASHNIHVVYVNFTYERRDLQFKVAFEPHSILRNFSWQIYFNS